MANTPKFVNSKDGMVEIPQELLEDMEFESLIISPVFQNVGVVVLEMERIASIIVNNTFGVTIYMVVAHFCPEWVKKMAGVELTDVLLQL
jgi:hypothetical protein